MLSVLMLFLIPVGGGIPAGVLLARNTGIGWPIAAGLYFVSDVLLACAFEPVLRLLMLDPMTGRAAALAAGHGLLAGWAIAIAGDMLYYCVVAYTTLSVDAYFRSPYATMAVVLAAMMLVPVLVRRLKLAYSKK